MYVCICNAVTDRDIKEAASRGVCSMDALGDQLKVATCCGRCLDHASKVLCQAVADAGRQSPPACLNAVPVLLLEAGLLYAGGKFAE